MSILARRTERGPGPRKLGVVLGDEVETGIDATLNAGVMLGPGETVKPGATVFESRVDGSRAAARRQRR
jgi:bifunctional UDP-N-acetylglucosamine pyrophosphorylase/glucosamine-1-phosphate N-acetyltransferase